MFSLDYIQQGEGDQLENIHKACFENFWKGVFFENLLKCKTAWGLQCMVDSVSVGFILLNCVVDISEIYTICVLPDFRKKGLAKALLKSAIKIEKEKKVEKIYLEVNEGNVEAQALYSQFGFRHIGQRDGYYSSSSHFKGSKNAYIYELFLPTHSIIDKNPDNRVSYK